MIETMRKTTRRMTSPYHLLAVTIVLMTLFEGSAGQAQVYAPVGDSVSITIQLPDQNTNIISPSGQTMIEVGFFGDPTVSNQYRDRVSVTNYEGGFGTPSITFSFGGVQLTDGGDFQCTSTFGGNNQCGPTLVVLGRPTLPQLSVTPSPVVVGRDIEMTCSATSTSQPPTSTLVLVYVLKQNGNVITQPRTSSFLIKGITAQNSGQQFQCVAYELNTVTNRLTGLESADSEVYVLDPQFGPTDIGASPNETSYSLNRGETIADIQCGANCNPPCDFQWYKAPNQQNIVAQGTVLSLGAVTSDEAGTYVCTATNDLGEKLLPIKIEVQETLGGITFDPPSDVYSEQEGTEIPAILCNAECVPACKIEWLKNGTFLYESDGINFGQVGRDDSGVYTCRATNDRGSREKTLTIDVLYGPARPTLTPAALKYDLEENAAILPDISCGSDCNPQCEVLWFREGGNTALSRVNLALGTATRTDTGKYECLVRNQLGEELSDLVSIQIFYKPERINFDPTDPSYDVEEGVNLEPIRCQASCVPECTFNWYKDNDLSKPAVPSDILDFGLADVTDAGLWTCVARNSYGQLQKQLRVDIAYGPKDATLTPAREVFTLAAETGVMPDVTCTANCNPTCSYTWFKNNNPFLEASNGTISLGSVSRTDEGNYTCRASNRLGSDTLSFQLVVTYGPSSSIVLNPRQSFYDVTTGSSLTVSCSATCDPECNFRWIKDTGVEASGTGELKLDAIIQDDDGVYECQATNGVGTPATARITVNVLVGPSSVNITPRGPLTLKEGTDFVLTCTAACTPGCVFTWKRDNQLVASEAGILSLTDVTRSTTGLYSCEAKNSVGTQREDIDIDVLYGAGDSITVDPDLDKIQVEEGRELNVLCSALCNPECQFRWLRGTAAYSTGPQLKVDNMTRSQAGVFTCIAENSAKIPAFKSTTVEIVYGPGEKPDIFPGEPIQSVGKGSSYQARCSDDCNPQCTISWYFGNRQLQTSNGILNIPSVTADNQGEYTCEARNSVGVATSKIQLQVQAGPGTTIRFNPPGNSQKTMEGRQFRVSCSAECSPPCSFHWQLGSRNVSDSGDLTFDSIQRDDAGVYICFASNGLDSVSSKQLEIEVMYGPEGSTRLIPSGTKTLDVGDTLNIICVSDCFPPCQYIWFVGQQEIPSQEGELKIESVELKDKGTYLCQANNDVGVRETKFVDVFVESGPGGSISFNPPNDTLTLTEGTTLQVTCSAECTPSCFYTWNLGQKEIATNNGVLNIPAIAANQRGDYTCVAANGEGNQASKVLSVTVQYGPHESIELVPAGEVQTLNEGASLQISCRSECNPPCDHEWYFVTTPLNTTKGVLSLVSLTKSDEGNYKCVASNGLGLSSEKDVLIQVQTGPGNSVQIDPPLAKYEVNEGTQLKLRCSAVCFPSCTYTWYFGSNRTKADDGIFLQEKSSRSDSGPYICYAANDVAVQGSQQIQVDILYGPSDGVVLDPAEDQKVEGGNSVTLRCSADCKPSCQYKWFKGNREVYSEGGRLVIGPATDDSKGDYSCQAYNKVDSVTSKTVNVEILKGPGSSIRLNPSDENPRIPEFSNITVTCLADCVPDCEYVWRQGDVEIPGSNEGVLRLNNIQRDDTPYYTCYATNGVGDAASRLLVLDVLYGPDSSLNLFPPQTTTTVGGDISVSCKAKCNPPCQVSWSKDSNSIPSQQGILTLTNVESKDSGNYTCTAFNVVGRLTGTAGVNVVSGGGTNIQFEPADTSVTIMEGFSYQVVCRAVCLPECQFVWTKDGEVQSQGPILEINNSDRKDGGVYTCRASNSAGTDVSQLFSLEVTYGPGSSQRLLPPVFIKSLAVGDSLLSRCEADCNPECNIVWLKDGSAIDGIRDGNLFVPSVTIQDGGIYGCVAENGIGQPAKVDMTLSVTFGPEDGSIRLVPSDRIRSVIEGDNFTVTCVADCLPSCSFTWFVGNYKYEENDGTLTIPMTSRTDSGTYTCHADNGVGRTRMLELQLFVEYPPGTPRLDPPLPSYQVNEGSDLPEISCSTTCSPRCQVDWLKDGVPYRQGSQLAFGKATKDKAGTYTCQAKNAHGESEISIQLFVNYPPSISLFTVRDRKFSAIVKENLPVNLMCEVDAKPAATISFYNGSQILYIRDNVPQISYAWKRANCLDAGIYSCQADNKVGDSASSSVELEVLCAPRLDPRVFKQPFVAGQIGGTAVISVPVVADPAPSFLWYKKKGSGVKDFIDVSGEGEESERFFYVNGSSSTLVIRNVQQDDFGDYVVSIANTEGTDNITFGLVAEGPPYKPQRLTASSVDSNTIELTWIPGFNGGVDQQYIIEFQKSGSEEWRRIDKRIDDREREVRANVTDLQPLTKYIFRLRGLNDYGYSQPSDLAVALTKESPNTDRQNSGDVNTMPVLLGVGLALGFLVGAGITAIVVVSRCRPKTGKHNGENTIDDFRSDTTYDTLYLKDALWAQRHIKLSNDSYRSGVSPYTSYHLRQAEDTTVR